MKQFKNTLYYWKGKNIHGHTLFGEVLGFSSNLVKAQLLKRGIQPILITKAKRHYFKKAINPFDIILFFRQLATLIKAGISASQAIHILSQNTNKIKFFRVILLLKDEVTAGNGLAVSLQKFPHYFDAITCHLILAGEKSGTLETILENIAHQKENLYLLKNKIKCNCPKNSE